MWLSWVYDNNNNCALTTFANLFRGIANQSNFHCNLDVGFKGDGSGENKTTFHITYNLTYWVA